MLWESEDALSALKKRFGFQDGASVARWVSDTLGASWGIGVDECERVVISAWNAMAWLTAGDHRLIAKWSAVPHLFPRLRDVASVTEWLHSKEIPTAVPIRSKEGGLLVDVANDARGRLRSRWAQPRSRFLLGVLPVLDGELLDVDDLKQVADAGEMLAVVHDALATYPGSVNGHQPRVGEQLVHNDFRSANILHDGERVTAVLDMEEIKYENKLADVAKAAVMLGCRYRNWSPTSAEARDVFIGSYAARLPLTAAQCRELDDRIAADLKEKGWA